MELVLHIAALHDKLLTSILQFCIDQTADAAYDIDMFPHCFR